MILRAAPKVRLKHNTCQPSATKLPEIMDSAHASQKTPVSDNKSEFLDEKADDKIKLLLHCSLN